MKLHVSTRQPVSFAIPELKNKQSYKIQSQKYWQSVIRAMNFEITRIHFLLSDVFVDLAVLVA